MKTKYLILTGLALIIGMMGSCTKKSSGSASLTDSTKVEATDTLDTTADKDTVAIVDTIQKKETLADKMTKQFSEAIDAVAEGKGKCEYFLMDITGDSIPDLFIRKSAGDGKQRFVAYAYDEKDIKKLADEEIDDMEFFCDGKELKGCSYIDNKATKGSWLFKKDKVSYEEEMSVNGVSQSIYDKMKPTNMPVVEWAEASDKESLEYYLKDTVRQ